MCPSSRQATAADAASVRGDLYSRWPPWQKVAGKWIYPNGHTVHIAGERGRNKTDTKLHEGC